METVAEIIPQIADFVGDSGTCAGNRARVLSALNEARLLVWDKGDWENTLENVCYCCADSCITLANRHKQVRAAWLCNQPLDLRGEWYQFVTQLEGRCGDVCTKYLQEISGYFVTFKDYKTNPFHIRIKPENVQDVGKEITFKMVNAQHQRVDVTLTIGQPFVAVTSLDVYNGVISVSKPLTEGRIRVYAYDPTLATETLIAIYEAEDQNPFFKKYRVPKRCGDQLVMRVKKKYFPLVEDYDLVEFDVNALSFAIMAVNARRDRNQQAFLTNLGLSVTELNSHKSDNQVKGSQPMKFNNPNVVDNLNKFPYWY